MNITLWIPGFERKERDCSSFKTMKGQVEDLSIYLSSILFLKILERAK